MLQCRRPAEVQALLRRVEEAVNGGRHAAGFLTYEAAAAFGLSVLPPEPCGLPLAWFGLYGPPREIPSPAELSEREGASEVDAWEPSLGEEAHARAFRRVHEHIARGDTYQVNYTFALRGRFRGDAWAFFARMAAAQRGGHAAFLDLGRHAVCSASPELFFRLEGPWLTTRPMKGTAPRGRTPAEDERCRERLLASEKDLAENLMIVDMLRNDLGRVAEFGSVFVPRLFQVERYPTLFQMTSTVWARSAASLPEILAALFPCASVTGAPKVRTMELIAALEPHSRGLYTGAIGHLAPGRRACFSVAIRTAVVDRARGEAVFGVGSGLVADSTPQGEWEECRLKARILTEKPFALLESLRWTPEEGFFLLDEHLRRLAGSAAHFGVPLDGPRLRRVLDGCTLDLGRPAKVRLTVDAGGNARAEAEPLGDEDGRPLEVGLAAAPVDSASPWLYHKTTRREAHEAALASRPDCEEVILWNERREVTEASHANLVFETEGGLFTPPVEAGALPGTLRARLLAAGTIRERSLSLAELPRCRRLYLINSVRGWREAALVGPP